MSAIELLPICLVAAFVIKELPPIVLQIGVIAATAIVGAVVCYLYVSRDVCYR